MPSQLRTAWDQQSSLQTIWTPYVSLDVGGGRSIFNASRTEDTFRGFGGGFDRNRDDRAANGWFAGFNVGTTVTNQYGVGLDIRGVALWSDTEKQVSVREPVSKVMSGLFLEAVGVAFRAPTTLGVFNVPSTLALDVAPLEARIGIKKEDGTDRATAFGMGFLGEYRVNVTPNIALGSEVIYYATEDANIGNHRVSYSGWVGLLTLTYEFKPAFCSNEYTRGLGSDACIRNDDVSRAANQPWTGAGGAPRGDTWNRWYVGGWAGFGIGSSSWSNPDDGDLGRIDKSGAIAGLYFGKNFAIGNNIVISAEADVAKTDVHGGAEKFGWRIGGYWEGAEDVKARIGLITGPTGDTLLYGSAGLAYGQYIAKQDWPENGNHLDANKSFFGGVIGAGLEHQIWNNFTYRLEYDFYYYGTHTVNMNSSIDLPYQLRISNTGYSVFSAGLSYQF